jgi:hypothetical protein
MVTKCVHRRDEWGNDHDRLDWDPSDTVAVVTKASLNPRGAVTEVILTRDRRVIWFTKEFRTSLSFCEERRIEELDRRVTKELCELIGRGDTIVGMLRISVSIYDKDFVSSVCFS